MQLYLKTESPLAETADLIGTVALNGYVRELRDGLNLGGGEYFKFSTSESEVLLVCNDMDHLEVFVEEMATFPFYCYSRKGGNAILEGMLHSLQTAGVVCELGDAYA